MSFFKKVGQEISGAFKKAPKVLGGIFKKGGAISQGLSKGLGSVGKVLGEVGKVGGQILNNPLVSGVGMALAPELYLGGQALVKGAQMGSKLAQSGSKLTDVSSYKKGHLENIQDAMRRAQDVQKNTMAFV
jgi:hypothetical protein